MDNKIDTLPVDVLKIAKASGIKVIKNSLVQELSAGESGMCRFDVDEGKWYIIYNDEASSGWKRTTISHEVSHIFEGHELEEGHYRRGTHNRKPKEEIEADMFGLRLLAPACVLWALDIHAWDDIARVCDIAQSEAKKRAERMKLLYERQKFLTSPLERRVLEQFKDFIDKNRLK